MYKPRLLDLFCGAGGASMGYHRAGFEVVGVDINPQPRYPFSFIQDDALAVLRHVLDRVDRPDVIAASPPCQHYSKSVHPDDRHKHVDLVEAVRDRLILSGLPYVIENVSGAPVRADFGLCGCHFDLPNLRRRRIFETNWSGLVMMPPCQHTDDCITVTGGHTLHRTGVPGSHKARTGAPLTMVKSAMGIDWMTAREMSQAIPPAYTEFIGRRLLEHLQNVPT